MILSIFETFHIKMSASLVTPAHEMYAKLKAIHYELTGHKLLPKLTYVCYDESADGTAGKYYGYFCLRLKPKHVYVLWIYAIGGGVQAMTEIMKVSKALQAKDKTLGSVKLTCSIDPGEEKNTDRKSVV